MEHLNSKNSQAMKNHYLLTQISDILMQLYLAWNPYIKELKQRKKYIFRVTGKFSTTNSNGRRCILHFQIHNDISESIRLF